MLKLNYGLIACGLLGAIGMLLLPLATVGQVKIMLLDAGGHGYLTLGASLVGAAMGAHNLFRAPARWAGGVAIVAFALVGMKVSGDAPGAVSGTGQTVGLLTAFVGMVLALVLTVKPGRKA